LGTPQAGLIRQIEFAWVSQFAYGLKKFGSKRRSSMKGIKLAAVLIAVLALAFCAACGSKGDQSQKATKTQSPVLSPEAQKIAALLPDDNAVAGWTRGAEVRGFGPDNLYEFIDGAADNFLIYGFQQVVTAEYGDQQTPSQGTLEIYQMQDPRNAFGVYASERNPDSEFKTIGAEGYVGGTVLNFWSGPYYVKITVFQESAEKKQKMLQLAESVAKKIGATDAVPSEINSFPSADQVPHSVRFLAKDVLGQIYFKEGFEAKYKRGDKESKIVIALPGDEAAAKDALDKYKQFIAAGGKVAKEVTAPGNGGFAGKDSYYGNMAAVRNGNRIYIALGGVSADAALAQAASCIKK
jgi:hypothetical protein